MCLNFFRHLSRPGIGTPGMIARQPYVYFSFSFEHLVSWLEALSGQLLRAMLTKFLLQVMGT